MSKLIGFERNDFVRDGKEVTGYFISVSREVSKNRGRGIICDKYYLSDRKIQNYNINLDEMLDQNILISFNRFGKIDTIAKV